MRGFTVSARLLGTRVVATAALAAAAVGAGTLAAPSALASQRYYSTGTATVTLRSGPGTSYAAVGSVGYRAPLDIACQVQGGTNVNGNRTWDRLTGGQWIADYWTTTPSFNSYAPGLGACPPTPAPSPNPGVTAQMQAAANWAIAEKNSPDPTWSDHYGHAWSGWCEEFAEQAEGFQFRFGSATQDYTWERDHGRIHTDANPPVGALVFYGGGNGYGHVAVSVGGGQAIGTLGYVGQRLRVSQYPVVGYLTNPYYGWALPIGS
jgi:hypothetical protein